MYKMQGDDPPFLTVGTDVSAKYKGAFCEAKIKKVVRNIKCKVTLKGGVTITVNDDTIKGNLHVGNSVEVRMDPKKEPVDAVISKMQDCSQYTVVFDDGDITTLRRSALCLKSGRHFNESETLDQLPLTHPEHFSTPVIAGRRGRRGRAASEESEPETRRRPPEGEREPHTGRVVLVETGSGGERRRPHQAAFPALVVAPTAQDAVKIKVKEDYLVRSFKDGRYYTVPKKEAREFRKGAAPLEWGGVEAALQYLNNNVLPPHWDRDALFGEPGNASDDSSDDEPREEKDHFVAQLYKFMDDRGTPLNRNPTIANRDIDLYRLFSGVQKLGGYNRVTNQNQWKVIAGKMGFHPATNSITNMCKQAYKKFLHDFEDFYRKLGVTLVAHPRGARTPPTTTTTGRSLIRDRDKLVPSSTTPALAQQNPTTSRREDVTKTDKKDAKFDKDDATKTDKKDAKSDKDDTTKTDKKDAKSDKEEKTKSDKEEKTKFDKEEKAKSDKEEKAKSDKEEKAKSDKEDKAKSDKEDKAKSDKDEKAKSDKEDKSKSHKEEKAKSEKENKMKSEVSDEDSADNQPLAAPAPIKTERKEKEDLKDKEKTEEKERKPRQAIAGVKKESMERRSSKARRPVSSKSGDSGGSGPRASRRPHASTDSDSSGRASRCGAIKKTANRRSQSANSASSGNTIASSNSSRRPRNRTATERNSETESEKRRPASAGATIAVSVGDKLKVYYGPPNQSESKVTYDAKVIEKSAEGMLRVHYLGWNNRYDEWIKPQRIAVNVTQSERGSRSKSDTKNRKSRAPRMQQDRNLHSDSDSDSDSDEETKRPPKRADDKSSAKASTSKVPTLPPRKLSNDETSGGERGRKRSVRAAASTAQPPSTPQPTPKRPRMALTHATHQGRDYDLNEIRSELKGLHTVKTEPEEVKSEPVEQTPPPPEPIEESKPEKPDDDVYEFKEPEPFELELHDEKKKRTHRIFDDVSPKYTMKSIMDDIEELRPKPTPRASSLSPFRDFTIRDTPGGQTPEDESRDDVFSLDGDFPGDNSLGPMFEGFQPAKNQETYSKKSRLRVARMHKDINEEEANDSAEDEPFSDDERIAAINNEDSDLPPLAIEPTSEPVVTSSDKEKEVKLETTKPADSVVEKSMTSTHALKPDISVDTEIKIKTESESTQPDTVMSPPNNVENITEKEKPILEKEKEKTEGDNPKTEKERPKIETEKPKINKDKIKSEKYKFNKDKAKLDKEKLKSEKSDKDKQLEKEPVKGETVVVKPLPKSDSDKKPDEIKKIEELKTSLPESVRSALIDTEESKSDPESPGRVEQLIEPPSGFLLHSEGPKIAEKLLKAINSAKKRLSTSPHPNEEPAKTPKRDFSKVKTELFKPKDTKPPTTQAESAQKSLSISSISPSSFRKSEPPKPAVKVEPIKPKVEVSKAKIDTSKMDPKKIDPLDMIEVFKIEIPPDSKLAADKREASRREESSLSPLQSALDVLERRRSGAELPLAATGKSNKVLSDTIQKLSTQITQGPAAIPMPTFQPEERSDSSDSDDSDRRLIIDKLSEEDTVSGSSSSDAARAIPAAIQDTTKSPVEWSAGESLLMLEDFCKVDRSRPHVSIPKPTEEDSNISLLLCEETIPGSPAPDGAASDAPAPRARSVQMPFASAPSNSPDDDSNGKSGRRSGDRDSKCSKGERSRERVAEWDRELERRDPELDNTPPTTPDTSPDASPRRERRMSEQDSMDVGCDDDNITGDKTQPGKLFGGRSRMVSESSGAGASAARRARRSRRDSDERPPTHAALNPKYNFYVVLDPSWDSNTRINLLTTRLAELRRAYHSVKAELAVIDRRRKKLRRKEREAVKAAKAACS